MRIVALALTLGLFGIASADAQSLAHRQTTLSVQQELERLPTYGVFDYLAFGVDKGKVTLVGYAYGGLKDHAARSVKRIPGVDEVANNIEALPASSNDDRIRWATFYRIYGDEALSRYSSGGFMAVSDAIYQARRFPGLQPFGTYPIHIVVKNGHTTLHGEVGSEFDKRIAEVRAREVEGVFSVDNQLEVSNH